MQSLARETWKGFCFEWSLAAKCVGGCIYWNGTLLLMGAHVSLRLLTALALPLSPFALSPNTNTFLTNERAAWWNRRVKQVAADQRWIIIHNIAFQWCDFISLLLQISIAPLLLIFINFQIAIVNYKFKSGAQHDSSTSKSNFHSSNYILSCADFYKRLNWKLYT